MSAFSSAADELTEKMSEARGMLTNLIFGKKQKKPRELVHTIQAYLEYLRIQQSQLALLSPQSQQREMNAAAAAAAANNAALVVLSPQGHTVTVHSLNSPVSSTTSVATPSSSAGVTPAASPANLSLATHAQGMSVSIPSPAHGPIQVDSVSGGAAAATPVAGSVGGSPVGGVGGVSGVDALPQSITAELDAIVIVLYGDASADATNKDPDPKTAKELIDLMFEFDLFRLLLGQLRYLEFEARKYFTRIFEYALTQRRDVSVPYMLKRQHMILQCIHAYEEKDVSIALSCDAILRACIACEPITAVILESGSLPDGLPSPTAVQAQAAAAAAAAAAAPASTATAGATNGAEGAAAVATGSAPLDGQTSTSATPPMPLSAPAALPPMVDSGNMVSPFFRYLHLPTFINSHAFSTFSLLLTSYPALSSVYLRDHYDAFFARYNLLLSSANYLTKVQAFTFLGDLLMERAHQEVMMRYVNQPENLKLAMQALRGPKAIQLAVFGVLKVFLPNPYKSDGILRILIQNKRNFLAFLDEFERDSEDETLCAHKAEMTHALIELPDSVPPLQKKASISNMPGQADGAAQSRQQPQTQLTQQQAQITLSPSEALP